MTSPRWIKYINTALENTSNADVISKKGLTTVSCEVVCPHCNIKCKNCHVLAGHVARVHKIRHISRSFAGENGVCRVCLKCFHNRPRLIHHLRQGSISCLNQYILMFPKFDDDTINRLDMCDRVYTQKAKAQGLSKLHASMPSLQCMGPLRPLIKTKCTPEEIALSVKCVNAGNPKQRPLILKNTWLFSVFLLVMCSFWKQWIWQFEGRIELNVKVYYWFLHTSKGCLQ